MTPDPAETPSAPAAPEPAAPQVQTIRRARIGTNVTIQIILGLALFVMANIIAHRRYRQWDFTLNRNFTLAENTKKFLSEIKSPVKITVVAPQEGLLERDMAPLLELYKKEMGERLELHFIDTRRDSDAWNKFQIDLNRTAGGFKPPTEEGVFVQTREGQAITGSSAATKGNVSAFFRWIAAESVFVMDKKEEVPVAFRGESLLNTAIAAVTDPERPRVGYIHGINSRRFVGEYTNFNTFADICSAQNIDLEPWLILDNPEYAPSYRGLILVSPNLFGEAQAEEMSNFIETPGNSLLVLLNPLDSSPEFDAWLSKYGIQPQNDMVLQAASKAGGITKEYVVDCTFNGGTKLTAGIENRATILPGTTRSLRLLTGTEKVRTENIDLLPILTPGKDFWGETKHEEALPVFNEKEDHGHPIYAAVSAERGAAEDLGPQILSSRIVVAGNADLSLPPCTASNYEFLTRSLNWMLRRTETAPNDASTDKAKTKFRITMKAEQWKRVFLICTIVLPLTALMAGLLIWSTRRN